MQKMVLEVLSSPGQGVYGVGMHELVLRTGLDYTKVGPLPCLQCACHTVNT